MSGSVSYAFLKDFDWSARVVMSSDKLSGLRRPMLLLKLDTVAADGTKEEHMVELNESELDEFLESLRRVQSMVTR